MRWQEAVGEHEGAALLWRRFTFSFLPSPSRLLNGPFIQLIDRERSTRFFRVSGRIYEIFFSFESWRDVIFLVKCLLRKKHLPCRSISSKTRAGFFLLFSFLLLFFETSHVVFRGRKSHSHSRPLTSWTHVAKFCCPAPPPPNSVGIFSHRVVLTESRNNCLAR